MSSNTTSQAVTWYYEIAGHRHGPVSEDQIQAIAAGGTLSVNTMVWRSGWSAWQPLEATELRGFVTSAAGGFSAPSACPGTTWHYEWSGQRLGPLSMAEMHALLAKGTLTRGSLVWRAGLEAWTPVESTELGEQLKLTTPPPLEGARINNNVVWLLAVSPLLIGALRYGLALFDAHGNELLADRFLAQNRYWAAGPLVSIALSYWDEAVLKKAGVNTRLLGQAWLVPVYLFKRAKALAQTPAYAWVWVGLFALGLLANV